MIEFKCSQCGEGMEAPQSLAGQVENCPECGTPNRVPVLAPAPPELANPNGQGPEESFPDATVPVAGPREADREPKTQSRGHEMPVPPPRYNKVLRYRVSEDKRLYRQTDDGTWVQIDKDAIARSQAKIKAELEALQGRAAEAKAAKAAAAKKRIERRQGACSRCGKTPRSLRAAAGNQWVCQTCYSETHLPRSMLATDSQLLTLRVAGFTVPDDLPREEANRLSMLYTTRRDGLDLPDDLTEEEYARFHEIAYLRSQGLEVADDVTQAECIRLSEYLIQRRWWPDIPKDTPIESLRKLREAGYERLATGNSVPLADVRSQIMAHAKLPAQNHRPSTPAPEGIRRFFKPPDDPTKADDYRLECIAYLRSQGLEVADNVTQAECYRLSEYLNERRWWPVLPKDTPAELLRKLCEARNLRLATDNSAPLAEVRSQILANTKLPPPAPRPGAPLTERITHFFTRVVGVTHKNCDGSDRQAYIGQCLLLDPLELKHEPDNPYDPNAVAVCWNGLQLGYLERELAPQTVFFFRSGFRQSAFVASVEGGTRGKRTLGVNIAILRGEPGVTEEEIKFYTDTIAPAIKADALAHLPEHDDDDEDEEDEEDEENDEDDLDDLDDDSMLE